MPNSSGNEGELTARYLPVFAFSFFLGLAFDYLFYGQTPGLQFLAYVVLISIVFFTMAARFRSLPDRGIVILLAPLYFFAAAVYVRAGEFLTVLNVAVTLVLLVLISEFIRGERLQDYYLVDYIRACFLVPISVLLKFFEALADLPSVLGAARDRDKTSQIIRGVALTLPVLFLLLLLLSSADLVFHRYVSRLVDIRITPELIFRAILVGMATAAFVGSFTHLFINRERVGSAPKVPEDRQSLGVIESSILLGSIDVLFLSFILVQVRYLFGGRRNISLPGVTYAEYARRGFFELIAVAVISFLVIWLAEKYMFREESGHTLRFKVLGSVLIVEVVMIMVSAFKRLALYEGAYGYTISRFYSHVFIVWLGVVFALLLVKILTNEEENALALRAFISALVFVAFLNFFNPDAFIARQNILRYQRTGKIDALYLATLSTDAAPEFVRLLGLRDKEIKDTFAYNFYWPWSDLKRLQKRGQWQSANLSRARGLEVLSVKATFLDKHKQTKRVIYGW